MITTWLAKLWPWHKWRIRAEVSSAGDVPDVLPRKTVIIVRDEGISKWLAFDCPCTGRHRVLINLDSRRRPFWKVLDKAPLSLHPSVDDIEPGRRCHYWIIDGRIHWV